MIDQAFAEQFADAWIAAWNNHDLERILAHYTDDFAFASPRIVQLAGEPSGKLQGKEAVGAYWAKGLQRAPDLHFELLTVLTGVQSVTLYYKGFRGVLAAEVFVFNEAGKVKWSAAHYAAQ